MLIEQFKRIDFVYKSLEITVYRGQSPLLVIKDLLDLLSLFNFEFLEELLLKVLRNSVNIHSNNLEVRLQIISQSMHKQMHLLEIFSTHLLLMQPLIDSLPVLLNFSC